MRIRYGALLLVTIGMIAAAAVTTAGPALAGVGSEPGNVTFSPASGDATATPTWSTRDGCPAGYRGSAQMSIFNTGGTVLSRISNVAYNVTQSFNGTLDGSLAAILRFANIQNGGSLEFVVGCYSQTAGTGNVQWIQSTLVTLSSDGKSYATSAPSGAQQSASGAGAQGTGRGPQGSGAGSASASSGSAGGGIGAPALAALIAAACALAAGAAGFVWYRRRNRSRLM